MMKYTIFILTAILLPSCTSPALDQEQEALIEVAGNKIHTKRVGTGQPIVLAHGGYLNLDMWDPQVDEFSKTHTLIRFSDLGHGESIHAGDKIFGYEIINELIKDGPDQEVILMGLSWGAMLCVDFALNYPEKVEKLILVSPGV